MSKGKIDLLSSMLKDCLYIISQNISFKARDLASLIGKINALTKSHGNFVYMCRETQHLLGKAVFTNGWEIDVTLNGLAFNKLMFLSNHLNFFNGTVIHNAPGSGKLAPLTIIKKAINLIQDNEITNENMLISDASDNFAFIFVKGDINLVEDFVFSPSGRNFSSSHRELLGLLKVMQKKSWIQVDNANLANSTITMAQETLAVPKLYIPFGLDITLFPNVYEFNIKNPLLIDAANIMLTPTVAKSTLKPYSQVVLTLHHDKTWMCVCVRSVIWH